MEAPLFGTPLPALGMVLEAERAHIGLAEAVGGASVFSGDTLSTTPDGQMRVRLGRAQLYLLPDSVAGLGQAEGRANVTLEKGTVVLASSGATVIELRTTRARIRPQGAQPTLAQVTLVNANEFLVTSQRGQLELLIGNEVHNVPEATSYRVVLDPEPAGSPAPPAVSAARSHLTLIVLIAIGIGTGIGIWRALVSPDRP